MPERIISALYVFGGMLSVGIGFWDARQRIRVAQRLYAIHGARTSSMPEGWSAWGSRGYGRATLGASWLIAFGLILFWILLGAGLFGLGMTWRAI